MTEKVKITRKTEAMKALEEKFNHLYLYFDEKEVYKDDLDNWTYSYYTVSLIENNRVKSIRFLHKRGYKTLSYYLQKALMTGGE